MARIRTIKPEFWSDGALIECSLSARLLFIGTWNFADDRGNLDRSAKQIKARVFPADAIDCEPLLHELMTQGLLVEYSASDKKYLHIQGFTKHQLIDRPSKPTCPAFDESLITRRGLVEDSQQEGKGREGKGLKTFRVNGVHTSARFSEFWEAWPTSPRKVDKKKCLEKWKSKNLDPLGDKILDHVAACRNSRQWREGFEPAPATYLTNERWLDGGNPDEQRPAWGGAV